jgi:hypothetical protein
MIFRTPGDLLQYLEENTHNAVQLVGYDDCILGTVFTQEGYVLCYDADRIIMKLQDLGMDYEGALDWLDFNVIGLKLEGGPVFLMDRLEIIDDA